MAPDPKPIEYFVRRLLQDGLRKAGLTELEKLIIASIVQNITYAQASAEYKYTESSLQNAAARLFKDLTQVLGLGVNRRNFLEVIEQARSDALDTEIFESEKMVLNRIQAHIWVRSEKAQLVSISYQAPQVLDLTEYLLEYSQRFGATFCLDVEDNTLPLDLLWKLGHLLQVTSPNPCRDTYQVLLKSIGAALKKRSTLLVIRFDRLPLGADRALQREYVKIFAALGMLENSCCWLMVDNDLANTEAERKRSLSYLLQGAIDDVMLKSGRINGGGVRLISIENDQQVIDELLQAYLK
jgi:hypothetical protein